MGWLSKLFGSKTMEIEITGSDGTVTRKVVDAKSFERQLGAAVAAGKATPLDSCVAHIVDPIEGEYTQVWTVGREIARDTYERMAVNGHVYVAVYYAKGVAQVNVLAKPLWEKFRATLAKI